MAKGGMTLHHRITRAMNRAIKQGEAGVRGQKSLDILLQDLMQQDVALFLKTVAPFVPRELIIDQSISITGAIDQARERLITGQVIEHATPALTDQAQVIDYTSIPEPVPAKDAASD